MESCCVPGCPSDSNKSKKIHFYNFPGKYVNGVIDPLQNARRLEWLKLVQRDRDESKTFTICSRHFVTGQPAKQECVYHIDWVPSINLPKNVYCIQKDECIDAIIRNLPEVVVQYDVPDYIILDRVKFNERKIEMDLIHKLTTPICDSKGYYINDHDYVGLPAPHVKTTERFHKEHSYSLVHQPACHYLDYSHFCNICRYNFSDLFSFNKHMVAHTTKNDVLCSICSTRFFTSTCLNNHLNTHTSLCETCGTVVPTVQIVAHQKENFKQKYKNSDILRYKISDKTKIYFCVLCMRKFPTDKEYSSHVFLHKHQKKKKVKRW